MRPVRKSLKQFAIENGKPKLLSHYSNDNPLSADEIGHNSTVNVKWTCEYGHTVIESPFNRVRRGGYCSICGKEECGSLAQRLPHLLKWWSPKNKISPDEIPPTYSVPIIWQCENGHEWTRRIALQDKLQSCPCCSADNNFFESHPELLKEWDYEENPNIDPKTVMTFSNKKYHWICANGHKYTALPKAIMNKKIPCPICSSAGYVNPEVTSEWHPTKNGSTTPFDYSAASQKNAWFICSNCGEEYMSRIAARVNRKTNKCPNCR